MVDVWCIFGGCLVDYASNGVIGVEFDEILIKMYIFVKKDVIFNQNREVGCSWSGRSWSDLCLKLRVRYVYYGACAVA